jgi:CheY-like chemotaxis protein
MPTAASDAVLVVDDDRDIADVVRIALGEEGVPVVILDRPALDAVRTAVDQVEPACVLLDSESGTEGYGASWAIAEWLRGRTPPVPVIMFTADSGARAEATENASERSRAAGFFAVLPKPFELAELERIVRAAIGRPAS